jgi:Protein of unknown function (DUF4236)
MGWRWWKSFGFGPLRTTLSNRGIGWNIGNTSFLRFGVGPAGAQYILVRIPGTGIGFIIISVNVFNAMCIPHPLTLRPRQDFRITRRRNQ